MTQLTWRRTVHSGDWCLRSALRTLSGACQKWWMMMMLNIKCACNLVNKTWLVFLRSWSCVSHLLLRGDLLWVQYTIACGGEMGAIDHSPNFSLSENLLLVWKCLTKIQNLGAKLKFWASIFISVWNFPPSVGNCVFPPIRLRFTLYSLNSTISICYGCVGHQVAEFTFVVYL